MPKQEKIEELTEAFPITGGRVSLAVSHSDIAYYWHPKKNCGFGPEDFSYGSEIQAWWICDKARDHVFQKSIKMRVRSAKTKTNGCPFCRGIRLSPTNWLAAYPELVAEFHPTKNGKLKPNGILATSVKKFHWRCSTCKLEWQMRAFQRIAEGMEWIVPSTEKSILVVVQ